MWRAENTLSTPDSNPEPSSREQVKASHSVTFDDKVLNIKFREAEFPLEGDHRLFGQAICRVAWNTRDIFKRSHFDSHRSKSF